MVSKFKNVKRRVMAYASTQAYALFRLRCAIAKARATCDRNDTNARFSVYLTIETKKSPDLIGTL
jgi:hypothetical protein